MCNTIVRLAWANDGAIPDYTITGPGGTRFSPDTVEIMPTPKWEVTPETLEVVGPKSHTIEASVCLASKGWAQIEDLQFSVPI